MENFKIIVGVGVLPPHCSPQEQLNPSNWEGWLEQGKIFAASQRSEAMEYWEHLNEADLRNEVCWEEVEEKETTEEVGGPAVSSFPVKRKRR